MQAQTACVVEKPPALSERLKAQEGERDKSQVESSSWFTRHTARSPGASRLILVAHDTPMTCHLDFTAKIFTEKGLTTDKQGLGV